MNVAYIRVSTMHQETLNQRLLLEDNYKIDRFFEEKVSGKNTQDRPVLREMLDFVREGDQVFVYDFSRLARSTRDLLDIVESLANKKVSLISHKEHIDTSTPTGKMLLTILGSIAEFERQNMLERQHLGIERAKAEGKYKGRAKKVISDDDFEREYSKYLNREITKGQLAAALGVSRPLLDRMLKERNL